MRRQRELTEFGAVAWRTRETFHGVLVESRPRAERPDLSEVVGRRHDAHVVYAAFAGWLAEACPDRPIFVSDNPAFDWQWINHGFHTTLDRNPFGYSARRISDFYAGLVGDFTKTMGWKRLRVTPHDHNPVNDAMGNVEAFERLLRGARRRRASNDSLLPLSPQQPLEQACCPLDR